MAGVTITSDANSVMFELGDYGPIVGTSHIFVLRSACQHLAVDVNIGAVRAKLAEDTRFLSFEPNSMSRVLVVDTVDGIPPTSNLDLALKLRALMIS